MPTYSIRLDAETIFGAANLAKWADADNTQNGAAIAARILRAQQSSYAKINDELRNLHYAIPFSAPYPQQIIDLEAMFTGIWLYSMPRGMVEGEAGAEQMLNVKGEAEALLAQIKTMNIRLDVALAVENRPLHVPVGNEHPYYRPFFDGNPFV